MKTTQTSQGSSAFETGLVLGGLIGAALGLWYAPRSGENTRKLVIEQGAGLLASVERAILGERAEDALAEGKALAHQRQIELSLEDDSR
ncbi:MAG: hypothetical protein Kow0077_04840 [Anaerolineae bacterium]